MVQAQTPRNKLHNARFNIQQRGQGSWSADNSYTADRWKLAFVGGTASISLFGLADADRVGIGDESAENGLSFVFAGGSSSGNFTEILQYIEDVRRLSGKTVTASFYAKALSGTPGVVVQAVNSYGTGGSPSANDFATGVTLTLSTVWQRYTATFTMPSASGKTFGTNGDSSTIFTILPSAVGTPIGAQSNNIFLWGIQLEVGSVATALEQIDPGDDFRRCQRFYQTGNYQLISSVTSVITVGYNAPLPVTMRSIPTIVATPSFTVNCGSLNVVQSGPGAVFAQAVVTAAGNFQFVVDATLSADF
jgi:hypothetical protein